MDTRYLGLDIPKAAPDTPTTGPSYAQKADGALAAGGHGGIALIDPQYGTLDPTGVASAVAIIVAALAKQVTITVGGSSFAHGITTAGEAVAEAAPVVSHAGYHYVDSQIDAVANSRFSWLGFGSVFILPDGVNLFRNLPFFVDVDGSLSIVGGGEIFHVANANRDGSTFTYRGVKIYDHTGDAYTFDNGSGSGLCVIDGGKVTVMKPANHAARVLNQHMDRVVIKDAIHEGYFDQFYRVRAGILELRSVFGTPLQTGGQWAYLEAGATGLLVDALTRWGGEAVPKTGVYSVMPMNDPATGNPTFITIEDHGFYSGGDSGHLLELHRLPNAITLGRGSVNSAGSVGGGLILALWDGSNGALQTEIENFQKWGKFVTSGLAPDTPLYAPFSQPQLVGVLEAMREGDEPSDVDDIVNLSDCIDAFAWNDTRAGQTFGTHNVSTSAVTDPHGHQEIQATATLGDAYVTATWATALSSCPAGLCTAVFAVTNYSDNAMDVYFQAGSRIMWRSIPKGSHVVSVPFYFQTGVSPTSCVVQPTHIFNGEVFGWSTLRIFKGKRRVRSLNTVLLNSSVPGSGRHHAGDVCDVPVKTEAGSGGSKYTVQRYDCTVDGTPGTWLAARALTGN